MKAESRGSAMNSQYERMTAEHLATVFAAPAPDLAAR